MVALLVAALLAAQDTPYTSAELTAVLKPAEELARRGRFLQASRMLRDLKSERVPAADAVRVRELDRKVAGYASLLAETATGDTADVPALTRIAVKNGGKVLGRVVRSDEQVLLYQTLTGISSRLAKERVDTLTPLTAAEAAEEVLKEFRRQCGNRGLMLQEGSGLPPAWKELGGRKVTGAQYFELAEFCARTGAGEYLAGLFDLAVAREPDIRATAHVAKSERLVNVLFYSLTVNQLPQANHSLDLLAAGYRDTAAYKDKLFADKEIAEIVKALLRRDLPEPKLPPPPAALAADPGPSAPAPAPEPLPLPALVPEPAPSGPNVAVTSLKLPADTPADVADLVSKGDRDFDQAMKHLLNSDPGINPDGWSKENSSALALFRKANGEAYLPAQDRYSKGWPQPLLDRVRETTMRIALCRKRSVRHD